MAVAIPEATVPCKRVCVCGWFSSLSLNRLRRKPDWLCCAEQSSSAAKFPFPAEITHIFTGWNSQTNWLLFARVYTQTGCVFFKASPLYLRQLYDFASQLRELVRVGAGWHSNAHFLKVTISFRCVFCVVFNPRTEFFCWLAASNDSSSSSLRMSVRQQLRQPSCCCVPLSRAA